MWQPIDSHELSNLQSEQVDFQFEYGTENEGLRVTITKPKIISDSDFADIVDTEIAALKQLSFDNQPENFTAPIKQGFNSSEISNDRQTTIMLSARPFLLLEAIEQVFDILEIKLKERHKDILSAIDTSNTLQLQKNARLILFSSAPKHLRPNRYSLMPESKALVSFFGMELNDKLPEDLSAIPKDLTFNFFSYKPSKNVIIDNFVNLATKKGITVVAAMPLAFSKICGGEHFKYLVENYHYLKSQGVDNFAILVPDIMDSTDAWARGIMEEASWVKGNEALRKSATLVEDHFTLISDPTRKIGNYLGIMELHPRGVWVPHRSSFVLGGNGLVLGSLRHENATFCPIDQDPKTQAAPKALLELISKGKQEHMKILNRTTHRILQKI